MSSSPALASAANAGLGAEGAAIVTPKGARVAEDQKLKIWTICEERGEEWVREGVAQCRWGERNLPFVQLWLERRESARNDASNAEQIDIARSAKDAAWEAARAAKSANTIATLALIAAVIAIAVSILGAFLG